MVQGGSTRLKLIIIVVVILIIGAVIAGVYYQPGSSSNSAGSADLAITLGTVKVLSADSSAVYLAVPLTLHNTASQDVTFYGASYLLSQAGAGLAQGYMKDGSVLAPGATKVSNQTVYVQLSVMQIQTVHTSGDWRIRGTADIRVGGSNSTVQYDFNFRT